MGEDYQRDKEYERYWYNEEGTLEDELEHVEYYKTGYYRAYPMFGYSNWNWQYQDIYLESKFPEEGDEKDKKKAIDYGKKLMEDLDFPTVRFLHILWESKVLKRWIWTLLHQAIQK